MRSPSSGEKPRRLKPAARNTETGSALAPAGQWHVATGVSPWKREVVRQPRRGGGLERSSDGTRVHRDAVSYCGLSVAPPGLVCFPCPGSTGSRPWLSAQVPPGPRVDRRSGSGMIPRHCTNWHLCVSNDVYTSGSGRTTALRFSSYVRITVVPHPSLREEWGTRHQYRPDSNRDQGAARRQPDN